MNTYQSQQFWNNINGIIEFTISIMVMGFAVGMVKSIIIEEPKRIWLVYVTKEGKWGAWDISPAKPTLAIHKEDPKKYLKEWGEYYYLDAEAQVQRGRFAKYWISEATTRHRAIRNVQAMALPEHRSNPVEIYTPEQEALDRSAEFTRMVREQGVNTKVKYVFVDAAWLAKSAYYPPPINQIEIFRTYPAFFRERDLAILAHEAGHAELYLKNSPPVNELLKEIEAYRKGMRLAKAWNVKDKFKELALHFTEDTLAGLPFERPVSAKDFEEAKPELERFLNELRASEG